MAYREGPVIEPAANPSSCFVPVQQLLDGRWNLLLFKFGRVVLQSSSWLNDVTEFEKSVPGFKLSPELAIA